MDRHSNSFNRMLLIAVVGALASIVMWSVPAEKCTADEVIPYHQDAPPGPPLTPAEAMAKMKLPPGFTVELVASEPDIVNPVSMTFDERGRIWITESFEYPRLEAGPGRDRVKILEDTDGDGRADKFTVFAEGLNIPSGIAIGAGGVWVANSPDLLLFTDANGDDRADKCEVKLTGFGRDDVHELPSALGWGPDGWLYGLNGVFNKSVIKHGDQSHEFTCAVWRLHPRTGAFELFAEGTSNPWGLAWDDAGNAFVSACVIDHLWHITESGYYHRQAGAYPPFTWKLGSIVDHAHQKAAYCGLTYFDSDAYPAEFRGRLLMGNIHGNAINVDRLERRGSTYVAHGEDDFLVANDAWFMPVSQKTGPDGCLYVLDWYDRYHCYQDARRDPEGIDRLKGRLYRIRYGEPAQSVAEDLSRESDQQLIGRLGSANIYDRETAQRLLAERDSPSARIELERTVLDLSTPAVARRHILWTLVSTGSISEPCHLALLNDPDPLFRAWGVRAAGNMRRVPSSVLEAVAARSKDTSPDVLVQVAIASSKIEGADAVTWLMAVLAAGGDDPVIPSIVWQNLHPYLEQEQQKFATIVRTADLANEPALAAIVSRAVERMLVGAQPHWAEVGSLVELVTHQAKVTPEEVEQVWAAVAARCRVPSVSAENRAAIGVVLLPLADEVLEQGQSHPLYLAAAHLGASVGGERALHVARELLATGKLNDSRRLELLEAMMAHGSEDEALSIAQGILSEKSRDSRPARLRTLQALGRLNDSRVAELVLAQYEKMEPDLKPQAIVLLTERAEWGRRLMTAISAGRVPVDALNLNQVRKLLATGDPELAELVASTWGTVRTDRNPDRERVVGEIRELVQKTPADPHSGAAVFKKVCAACHKIHGEGQDVGPDLTQNGRNSFDQLLSNVFDPSLVIGAAYQARSLLTTDGRVLTGILVESSPDRVIIKVQGGTNEEIPREQIDELAISDLSMMPEGLEKQLTPREIADLMAFLCLDKPPGDPSARLLSGSGPLRPASSAP